VAIHRLQRRTPPNNHPPPGESWVWLTREMIESEAWRSLSRVARLVIDRVILEHMAHAGTENGSLVVTYSDFVKFGIRRGSVKAGIVEAVERGLIVVTEKGRASVGPERRPSKYALGWLPMKDGSAAGNRWKHWHHRSSVPRPLYTRDIESNTGSGTRENGGVACVPVSKTPPAGSNRNAPGELHKSAPHQ
jgi:hypothetical protein